MLSDRYTRAFGSLQRRIPIGLLNTACAEATDGIMTSLDSAVEGDHNAEDAATFFAWWGDRQVAFYGVERLTYSRRQQRLRCSICTRTTEPLDIYSP